MAIVDALSRALVSSGVAASTVNSRRTNLTSGGLAVPSVSSSKVFSLSSSKDALTKASEGARNVLSLLEDLSDVIGTSDGMSSGSVTGSDGRIGLQAEIRRLTGKIDEAVAEAGGDEINLIATPSTTYHLRSSTLGGSIAMVSQPMDSQGLGLDDLDVSTQEGSEAAKETIQRAIRDATERYNALSNAAADLPVAGSVGDALVSSLKSLVSDGLLTGGTGAVTRTGTSSTNTLGRGAVVNFQA